MLCRIEFGKLHSRAQRKIERERVSGASKTDVLLVSDKQKDMRVWNMAVTFDIFEDLKFRQNSKIRSC